MSFEDMIKLVKLISEKLKHRSEKNIFLKNLKNSYQLKKSIAFGLFIKYLLCYNEKEREKQKVFHK